MKKSQISKPPVNFKFAFRALVLDTDILDAILDDSSLGIDSFSISEYGSDEWFSKGMCSCYIAETTDLLGSDGVQALSRMLQGLQDLPRGLANPYHMYFQGTLNSCIFVIDLCTSREPWIPLYLSLTYLVRIKEPLGDTPIQQSSFLPLTTFDSHYSVSFMFWEKPLATFWRESKAGHQNSTASSTFLL